MDQLLKLKCDVARSQLSGALHLYIADADPIAVHCLACGGAEVAEGVAMLTGKSPFLESAMEAIQLKKEEIRSARTKHWNPMKHLWNRSGNVRTGDLLLLQDFKDEYNDGVLFCGWHDYMLIAGALPLEAQVFQLWFWAMHDVGDPGQDDEVIRNAFPGITQLSRPDQKALLRAVIKQWYDDPDLRADRRTEPILVRNLGYGN